MKPRRYRLLCPIARALDRVGDRWTLLILRDLHAGPARFSELQSLPGIASNLLTNRLRKLEDDGLVRRSEAEYGNTLYELTELGSRTANVLFELAAFGGNFPPDQPAKRPGNLRTIAVTLQVASQRAVEPGMNLKAQLIVDGEPFAVNVTQGVVDVSAGRIDDPEASLETEYEALVAVADGRMPADEFATDHAAFSGADPERVNALASLMTSAVCVLGEKSSARP